METFLSNSMSAQPQGMPSHFRKAQALLLVLLLCHTACYYQTLYSSPQGRAVELAATPGLQADVGWALIQYTHHWVLPAVSCLTTPFSLQIGHIEGQPERKGVFPVSFVHILSD